MFALSSAAGSSQQDRRAEWVAHRAIIARAETDACTVRLSGGGDPEAVQSALPAATHQSSSAISLAS